MKNFSDTIKALLRACIDSANNMLRILSALREQNLLGIYFLATVSSVEQIVSANDSLRPENFLPSDLENTFSASFVLAMASVILSNMQQVQSYKTITAEILDDMILMGSVPALFRKTELEQLEQMVNQVKWKASCDTYQNSETQRRNQPETNGPASDDGNGTRRYHNRSARDLGELSYEQIFSEGQTFSIDGGEAIKVVID